jgi:hypothetical protein
MVLFAVYCQPQYRIGDVGTAVSRTRSSRRGRNEDRGIAGPRPGWDMLLPSANLVKPVAYAETNVTLGMKMGKPEHVPETTRHHRQSTAFCPFALM